MQKCPVKIFAEEHGIPVISPEKVKNNEECFNAIKNASPDFIIVYSFGRIIPKSILDLPKYECLNIHASLLPMYRGAAPIQRAVLDGNKETGISIMRMEEGLDTGAVYAYGRTAIERKTSAMLFKELTQIGSDILLDCIPKIASGELSAVPQDGEGSYAEMISKDESIIDWSETAEFIDRKVRAFNDAPVARTMLGSDMIKIYETEIGSAECSEPGKILSADKGGIEVACGKGSIIIKMLQAPGKKPMSTAAYLLGNKIEIGSFLE